ncbi:MAG: cell division protein FtsZ [Varibaculum sp.]|nr:cell division protein FtsZ [Varibaculum sp.]
MAVPEDTYIANIKVVGIGGGGVNAVNRMVEVNLEGVEFVAINTDAQALMISDADVKLDIGREETRGLGAGADPEVGKRSASDNEEAIAEILAGADMVFVTAGEGGGTGTGGAPVVARLARESGALTIGVVTKPFEYEGARRMRQAEAGIEELRDQVDALIVIPNERLLEISDPDISVEDAFRAADEVLRSGVQGITDLITSPAVVNVDFADVRSVLKDAGTALMGIGAATGEDRALRAAEMAIASPLLEASIDGAHAALLFIQGGSNMGLKEVVQAATLVREAVHSEANIIVGQDIDDSFGDEMRVTVIAAGFDSKAPAKPQVKAATPTSGQSPIFHTDSTRSAPAHRAEKPVGAPVSSRPLGGVSVDYTAAVKTEPPAEKPEETEPDDGVLPIAKAPQPVAEKPNKAVKPTSYYGNRLEMPRIFDDDGADDDLDVPDFLR